MFKACLLFVGMLVFGLLASDIIGGIPLWVNLRSAALVVIGTLVGGLLSAPVNSLRDFMRTLSAVLKRRSIDHGALIRQIVSLARIQRVCEVRELSIRIKALPNPFLRRGLQLALDLRDRRNVEAILDAEIARYLTTRHAYAEILHAFTRLAPVFGFVGTVVGLINVLNQLGDASQIGHGMAISLLTTFYGLVLANFVFVPLTGKMADYIREETRMLNIVIEGVLALCDNCAPLEIESRLASFLDTKAGYRAPDAEETSRFWQKLGLALKQGIVTR